MNRPAPRWFRISKRLINNTSTFSIAILMLMGHRADDTTLLIIKLSLSFLVEQLETFLSNGEVYADISQVKKSALEPVMDVKPVEKKGGGTNMILFVIATYLCL